MKEEHEQALWIGCQGGELGDKPTLNLENWLLKVRKLLVLSTFSLLGQLQDTKHLSLSSQEDREKSWVCMAKETMQIY